MPGNRTHINHTLQNELSPFEKIRKIEWASFWFFLAGFLISLFGLIVSLGMNIYLPTLIFFFTFILLLILVGLKAISYPSSEKENQIISTLFNYLISQTLTEGTFKLQGEIPVKDIRESLLFFDYIHYHKGYRITGLLNQQPINIYQLQLQKEENDAYYEGCFMSGTCINPFKSDVFIYHPSVDKTEEFENKKKAYCGSYSRSGQMDFVTNTLESFCFSNLLARNWGTSQHTPYNPLIHIHTTNPYGIKGYLNRNRVDKLTRLFEIFPNCQMHISFRGNTFYVAIGTKKLIPFQWNKSFTNKQTIEEYSDTYLKLIDVANILIHLHERKKHLLPDGEFLSGEYQDLTF